jgi:hypothetical protein
LGFSRMSLYSSACSLDSSRAHASDRKFMLWRRQVCTRPSPAAQHAHEAQHGAPGQQDGAQEGNLAHSSAGNRTARKRRCFMLVRVWYHLSCKPGACRLPLHTWLHALAVLVRNPHASCLVRMQWPSITASIHASHRTWLYVLAVLVPTSPACCSSQNHAELKLRTAALP